MRSRKIWELQAVKQKCRDDCVWNGDIFPEDVKDEEYCPSCGTPLVIGESLLLLPPIRKLARVRKTCPECKGKLFYRDETNDFIDGEERVMAECTECDHAYSVFLRKVKI
jgi:RNase P subunit RPR2